jgi:ribulose-bisphosphate carboxylase small chain
MASLTMLSAMPSVARPAVQQTASIGRICLKPAAPCSPVTRTATNGSLVRQMMVWEPTNNKYFETLSYLPPLSDAEISKQVDYITRNGWVPTLEFANADIAYVSNENTIRMGAVASNYYDNRYWTMYKLPMFGCTDSAQVLKEIASCKKSFPDAYIRLVAFDSNRQVQIAGFLVSRPSTASDYRKPTERSV